MIKEISAAELEQSCRKCVRVTVSDIKALTRVLDAMQLEYSIADDTTADIFAKISVTKLVNALNAEHCEVFSMQERDESLESYFMNLVGGDRT